jgi:hypothetical protein
MILCIMILTIYILNKIKRLRQGYTDRMEEHSILRKNLMRSIKTPRRKTKKKTSTRLKRLTDTVL